MPSADKGRRSRPKKEAFYVRVDTGGGTLAFFNATEHIGRPMPFTKPKATCAMRVGDGVVAWSLLHLTKRNAATLAEKPVVLPKGPLARLERRAVSLADLGADRIVAELTLPDDAPAAEPAAAVEPATPAPVEQLGDLFDDEPATPAAPSAGLGDLFDDEPTTEGPAPVESPKPAERPRRAPRPTVTTTFELDIIRDPSGKVLVSTVGDADETFELPKGAVHLTVFLRSAVRPITLAVGFIGHIGKPGDAETVSRAVGMVLNSMSHLPEFRVLSGIETVALGDAPNRVTARRVRRNEDLAAAALTVRLYNEIPGEQPALVGAGEVVAEFDLENANPTSGRLLVTFNPDAALAEVFTDEHRRQLDAAINQVLHTRMQLDEVEQITYDIILGGVDSGTTERLRDVLRSINAIDVTTAQFRVS